MDVNHIVDEDVKQDPITDAITAAFKPFAEYIGLRYAIDWRTLGSVGIYFGLFYFLWHNGSSLSWPVWSVCWTLLNLYSLTGAVITHNTMHLSLFKREYRIRNYIFQLFLSLTYGHPVSSYVPGHNLSHHKYTQLLQDCMRTSKLQYKWHFLNGLLFQPTVTWSVLKGDIHYLLIQQKMKSHFFYQAVREGLFVGAVTLILVYIDYWRFFLYFYMPHIFAQWAIVGINIIQHDGCDVNPMGVKGGNDTRNFTGKIANYLLLNNGYHGIHHIKPHLHWSLAVKYHEMYCNDIHPNLNQENLATYLFKTFIYPAQRLTYDGKPVTFDETTMGPDAEWVAYPRGIKPEDISLLGAAKDLLSTGFLIGLKVMMPMYSPVFNII